MSASKPANVCMQRKAAPQKVTRPEGALRNARTLALRRRHAERYRLVHVHSIQFVLVDA